MNIDFFSASHGVTILSILSKLIIPIQNNCKPEALKKHGWEAHTSDIDGVLIHFLVSQSLAILMPHRLRTQIGLQEKLWTGDTWNSGDLIFTHFRYKCTPHHYVVYCKPPWQPHIPNNHVSMPHQAETGKHARTEQHATTLHSTRGGAGGFRLWNVHLSIVFLSLL